MLIAVISVTESWCLAMYRDVERGFGVLDPILHVFLGGFQLPALTTLFRMGGQYGDFFQHRSFSVAPVYHGGSRPLWRLVTAICGASASSCSRSTSESDEARSQHYEPKQLVSIVTPVFNEVEVIGVIL